MKTIDAEKVSLELERLRQKHESDHVTNPDHIIRICQAIVAKEAGYHSRNDWSASIFKQVDFERNMA